MSNVYTFIDLFAGIGGTRKGFEMTNQAKCVFTSEWDKYAQITYSANYNGDLPHGDITKIPSELIPEFEILLAGFPCQPFSIAGVSKKISLGRLHGFQDEKQGNLFFEIARILNDKQPPAFMLENVKNLVSHDKGNTFKVIMNTLHELGYKTAYKVIDGKHYVPQHRERTYIVGFKADLVPDDFVFDFPDRKNTPVKLKDILEKNVPEKYTLSDKLWNYLQNYAKKHKEKGNGFGYGMPDPDGITRTLSARYGKDGSEILIAQEGKNPRRLTPRECARLMGFPDNYNIVVSDTQAYKQFGNSIIVPVVHDIATRIVKVLDKYYGQTDQRKKKLEHVQNKGKEYETGNASQERFVFERPAVQASYKTSR